jgi:parallel beta-helix repeat protein
MRFRVAAIGLAFALGVALAGGTVGVAQAAGTQRYVTPSGSNNATCLQAHPCQTVTAGIAAAAPGDTVNLAAGTYTEQVTVTKSVTIKGAGKAQTTIKAPASYVLDSFAETVEVEIGGGATVAISKLTIAGPAPSPASCAVDSTTLDYGVFVVGGATLNLSNAAVNDIFNGTYNGPLSGCQNGVAIRIGAKYVGQVGHGTINNVTVAQYEKGGVVVDGPGTTADITNSDVIDLPQTTDASNGIQISRGATATVSHNTVSGNECNLAAPICGGDLLNLNESQGTGILTFNAGQVVIESNKVTGNDAGIALFADSATDRVAQNTLNSNRYVGLVAYGGGVYDINDNTLNHNGEYGLFLTTDGTHGVSNANIVDNSAFHNGTKDMYADASSRHITARANDCATAVPSLAFWGCDGNGGRF